MRRAFLPWLLSLLLVLVQHGAVLHELGHLNQGARSDGPALHVDRHDSTGAYCPTCEAFAQIANPVGSAAQLAPSIAPALLRPAEAGYSLASADVPTPRSRGPPQI